MKVKICGITQESDALFCEKIGVEYLGFNFFKLSKRYIYPEKAREIISSLRNAKAIGVFVEPEIDHIEKIVSFCNLSGIQIYADQSVEFCNRIRKFFPKSIVIQAFRIRNTIPENILAFESDYFLFDSFDPEMPGGTGKTFNWDILPLIEPVAHKSFIAGGINPDNIDKLLSSITPFGIDIASGVEKSPGIKDKEKIKKIMERVTRFYEKNT